MTEPLVSVAMPCYNEEKYIRESIESVLNQTYRNVEIVVVDDGSTDGSADIIREYPVRLRQQENLGGVEATNNAVASTTGEFVMPMSTDDILDSHYLEKTVPILADSDPKVSTVYTWIQAFGDEHWLHRCPRFDFDLLKHNYNYINGVLRRSAWDAMGGMRPIPIEGRPRGCGLEDWDLNLRLAKAGWDFILVPEPLYFLRVHAGSNSVQMAVRNPERQAAVRRLNPTIFPVEGNI